MKKSIVCRLFVMLLFFSSLLTVLLADDDPQIVPGARFRLEFPDEQLTLAGNPPGMGVQLPTAYSKDKKYPLFLWFNGGSGGAGSPSPDVVDADKYICIGLPLFKKIIKSKKKKKKKSGVDGVHLRYKDVDVMWSIYKKMFKRLEELLPNIEKGNGVVGGFSNGAHAIAILMTGKPKEFRKYFGAFIFIEGGYMYKKKSSFRKSPIIALGGDSSWAIKGMGYDGSPGMTTKSFIKKNSKKKLGKVVIMKDTGHSFNKKYIPEIKEWLKKHGF